MKRSTILPFRALFAAILLAATSFFGDLHGAQPVPQWVSGAASKVAGDVGKDADALILEDSFNITVSPDDAIDEEYRGVLRILTPDGSKYARGVIHFCTKSDTVDNVHAWLILPDGKVRNYEDNQFIRAENRWSTTVYSEMWLRVLDLSPSAVPGTIFAYTYRIKSRLPTPQIRHYFSDDIPVLDSTIRLTLPKDWTLSAVPVKTHPPRFTENVAGNTYTWVAEKQSGRSRETMMVRGSNNTYLGINLHPTPLDLARTRIPIVESWKDTGAYIASLSDPSTAPDDAIRAKVAELTQNRASEWERIQSICEYVQGMPYINIDINMAWGGGYTPNPASVVFARHCGDCKDKAALLRSMLSCLGLKTYSVSCYAEDDDAIDPEWPSPYQFNHAIAAIVVSKEIGKPACVDHPQLGRLMLFDPTCSAVPVGHVPSYLQGTYYLVNSSSCVELARFPEEDNVKETKLDATLDADGALAGELHNTYRGAFSEGLRRNIRWTPKNDMTEKLADSFRKQNSGTSIKEWSSSEDDDANATNVRIRLDIPAYARHIGSSRLLFHAFAGIVLNEVPELYMGKPRQTPIQIENHNIKRDSVIKLPEGFVVDELPEDLSFAEPFGKVSFHAECVGNELHFHMEESMVKTVLPPSDFEKVRSLYKAFNTAAQSTAVIRRAEKSQ